MDVAGFINPFVDFSVAGAYAKCREDYAEEDLSGFCHYLTINVLSLVYKGFVSLSRWFLF